MALLEWLAKRRAARRYACDLAPWLARNYGASEHYLVAQIRAALAALKLDGRFAAIAYAAFLTRDNYDALASRLATRLDYDEARNLFRHFVRPQLRSAYGEPGGIHDPPEGSHGSGSGT